ncbi:MAG: DNA recombination protein RmuC [Candidatus Parcubacteria bacterium]|nr:DNA recombination protein RmuC [Candidatus Parcubacteria bacterium]
MTDLILLSAIFAIMAVVGGLLFFFIRKSSADKEKEDKNQSNEISEMGKRMIDLERHLTELMTNQLKEIRGNVDGTSKQLNEQIHNFTKETTQIREGLKQIQDKVKDVSSFQDIFKSPKLRGQWGEASLEHIISQHFPKELFKVQHHFLSGEIVDAVLKLPNGRILPIDAKFPTDNFDRMVNALESEKASFRKDFLEDVKQKIQDIAQKYILPAEGTTDFALMYIPAEAVYYEIMNNFNKEADIASFAWSRKIILSSPNTIYLTLRTIEHWFRDTQITKQTQEILKKLGKIYTDSARLMQDFKKLGSHIRNASSAYETSEKRLTIFEERVEKLIDINHNKKLAGKTK